MIESTYRRVANTNARYGLENQLFFKRSKYIRIEYPLHKQSEKPACASKRDVLEFATLW
jgi:hypothetical protein